MDENVSKDVCQNRPKIKIFDRCAYIGCTRTKFDNGGTPLHRFPFVKDVRFQKWIRNAGNPRLLTLSSASIRNYGLCNLHFADKCFVNSDKLKLNWNAVPNPCPEVYRFQEFGVKNGNPTARNNGPPTKNPVPVVKNLVPIVKNIVPGVKNVVPLTRSVFPIVKSVGAASKNVVPVVKNVVPVVRNTSPVVKNVVPAIKNVVPIVKNVTPGVRNVVLKVKDAAINPRVAVPSTGKIHMADHDYCDNTKTVRIDEYGFLTFEDGDGDAVLETVSKPDVPSPEPAVFVKHEPCIKTEKLESTVIEENKNLREINVNLKRRIQRLKKKLFQAHTELKRLRKPKSIDEFLNEQHCYNTTARAMVKLQLHRRHSSYSQEEKDLAKQFYCHSATSFLRMEKPE